MRFWRGLVFALFISAVLWFFAYSFMKSLGMVP